MVSIFRGRLKGTDGYRVRDLVASSIGLAVLIPVYAAAALSIRCEGSGPILFRQKRVGLNGAEFAILKFRTMQSSNNGPKITSANDSRITTVGRILRKYKVDELPQLINVLRGEMSLVGPRPEVSQYVDLWPVEERGVILSVRPGVTDPASVLLRNESDYLAGSDDPESTYVNELLPRKTRIYSEYVQNRTFIGDIGVILDTFVAIIRPNLNAGGMKLEHAE